MQVDDILLSKLQSGTFKLENTSSKMSLSAVFNERRGSYLNEMTLFVAHFNTIPNFVNEVDIDCMKVNRWIVDNYSSEIKDFYFNKRYFKQSKKVELDDIFYFLYDDLLVDIDVSCSIVRFLFHKTDLKKVQKIISGIRKFKI
jgi:hypothetical protein